MAWSRHSLDGVSVSLKALWRPEGHFDEIGMHQIKLARRLLTIGIMAYLGYGFTIVAIGIARGAS
jgi:hypothetical protein